MNKIKLPPINIGTAVIPSTAGLRLVADIRARDLEVVRVVQEDARPEPDCRTCASSCSMDGRAVCILPRKHCANGDRYEPLPPVRLWRTAP